MFSDVIEKHNGALICIYPIVENDFLIYLRQKVHYRVVPANMGVKVLL
jgi:hypothetical protein